MISHPLKNVEAWVAYFDQADIPVLTRTERELVARVQSHAKEAHDLTLSEEQVLAMAEIDD